MLKCACDLYLKKGGGEITYTSKIIPHNTKNEYNKMTNNSTV